MVYSSKKCRSVGQHEALKGRYSTARGAVEMCVELSCIVYKLSSSAAHWLAEGPLCDTNFALSTPPLSGHG